MTPATNVAHVDNGARHAGDKRHAERPALGRHGVLRIDGHAPSIEVVVRDLTRDGCGIESDAPVEPGMRVEIGIANIGRVPATVLWRGANGFGCMFDQTLPSGSVTAAFGPRNVVPFPSDAMRTPTAPGAVKFPVTTRLLVIGGFAVLCWGGIGALAFAIF